MDAWTVATCGGLAVTTTAYALFLRANKRRYIHRWTWATVALGVGIVLGWVAFRFGLPVEGVPSAALLGWAWMITFAHFVAGGTPIIIWQVAEDRADLEAALAEAQKAAKAAKAVSHE